jgi:hypothetical protein
MVELSDQFGTPHFPHRGSPEKRAQPTQGKLFADPKPADAQRYQRGYTPERMAEVRSSGMRVESAVKTSKSAEYVGPSGVAQLKQVIARSDTPAPELKGMHVITASPKVSRDSWANFQTRVDRTGTPVGPGEIHLSKAPDRNMVGQALLHEMGHWKSQKEGTPHNAARDPVGLGQEEAFADDNMLRRWRPDPRDERRGQAPRLGMTYERKGAMGRSASGTRFTKSYLKHRQEPLRTPEEDRRHAAMNADASYQPNLNSEQFGRMG